MKRRERKDRSRKRKNSEKKDPLPIRIFKGIGKVLEKILLSILWAIINVALFIWDNKVIIAKIILLILLACYCFFTTKSLLKIEEKFNTEMTNIKTDLETQLETQKEENEKLKTELDSTKTDLETKIEEVKVSKAEKKKQEEEEAKRKAEQEEKARQESIRIASTQVTSRGGSTIRTASTSSSGSVSEYQAYAKQRCFEYGWSESDFQNLVTLWNKESGWNPYAKNPSSGAYGIPQSLPASKMASHGSDYLTNYKTQINWGLDYIKNRYGNPTNAMSHSRQTGWY